jgi:hypothetical protein
VPRAARYAALQAVKASPKVVRIVSDHLSLVQEGQIWCERGAMGPARHAEIWRALRGVVERQARPPPSFAWTPSHKTLEAGDGGGGVHAWLGNAWADFFASVALHVVCHSPSFHKALEIRLSEAIANAKVCLLGWRADFGIGVLEPFPA